MRVTLNKWHNIDDDDDDDVSHNQREHVTNLINKITVIYSIDYREKKTTNFFSFVCFGSFYSTHHSSIQLNSNEYYESGKKTK